jgi:hypothetical protein
MAITIFCIAAKLAKKIEFLNSSLVNMVMLCIAVGCMNKKAQTWEAYAFH